MGVVALFRRHWRLARFGRDHRRYRRCRRQRLNHSNPPTTLAIDSLRSLNNRRYQVLAVHRMERLAPCCIADLPLIQEWSVSGLRCRRNSPSASHNLDNKIWSSPTSFSPMTKRECDQCHSLLTFVLEIYKSLFVKK